MHDTLRWWRGDLEQASCCSYLISPKKKLKICAVNRLRDVTDHVSPFSEEMLRVVAWIKFSRFVFSLIQHLFSPIRFFVSLIPVFSSARVKVHQLTSGPLIRKDNRTLDLLVVQHLITYILAFVFLQASNSSSYIQDAGNLLVPVLQVGVCKWSRGR